MKKIKIGIVGCGNISDVYLENLKKINTLEVVACADIVPERAREKTCKFEIPNAYSVEQFFSDPEIEIAVNLTIPDVHAEITLRALNSNKSVYSEKPLAVNLEDAKNIIETANSKDLLVGCAPDTFLSGAYQKCRQIIDRGQIGRVIAAQAFMMASPPEQWHPAPEFLYQKGAGPLFDMGPYYLTALIHLLGPVKSVMASAATPFAYRVISSLPQKGSKIKVETPTYITGIMNFVAGTIGTLTTTFDAVASELPHIEIHGSKGSISLPDPNGFGGNVRTYLQNDDSWQPMYKDSSPVGNKRGIGIADMANAHWTDKKPRANSQMAYHVLEIMHAFLESSKIGKQVEIKSTCKRPEPLDL